MVTSQINRKSTRLPIQQRKMSPRQIKLEIRRLWCDMSEIVKRALYLLHVVELTRVVVLDLEILFKLNFIFQMF